MGWTSEMDGWVCVCAMFLVFPFLGWRTQRETSHFGTTMGVSRNGDRFQGTPKGSGLGTKAFAAQAQVDSERTEGTSKSRELEEEASLYIGLCNDMSWPSLARKLP